MTQSSLAGGHSLQGTVTLPQPLSASRILAPAAVQATSQGHFRCCLPLPQRSNCANVSLAGHCLSRLTEHGYVYWDQWSQLTLPAGVPLPLSLTVNLGTTHELYPAQCPRRCLDRTTQPCPPKSKASTPPRSLHIAHSGTPPVALRLLRDSCPQPRHKTKRIGLPVQVNTSDLRSLSLGLSWQSKG